MSLLYKMRWSVAAAACVGLALRLFFVVAVPATNSGDSPFYIELAWNWLKKGVYGFSIDGQLTPVDMRLPGYPAFLATVFAFVGNSQRATMLAQVVLDLATCFLVAAIAARIAPPSMRHRVALVALWMAVLCPFTANYTAVILTETLVTFLTALAVLLILETDIGGAPLRAAVAWAFNPWLLVGIVAGFGTLVRPETPLVLAAAGLVLVAKFWRPREWGKLARPAALMAAGLVLPLLPWAARNWCAFHEVQFLAPRYSQLPGEVVPYGFTTWTGTWLWRMSDVYLVTWKLNSEAIPIGDVPAVAFDSAEERSRVAELLAQHNDSLTLSADLDRKFGDLARERTARDPLRTYLKIPLQRALAIWFTPRTELLPVSGHLWPVAQEWNEDRSDFLTTLALTIINCVFLVFAFAGAWRHRHIPGVVFLVVLVLVRTAFFAWFVDTPEPRYVLECFPAIIALAALACGRSGRSISVALPQAPGES